MKELIIKDLKVNVPDKFDINQRINCFTIELYDNSETLDYISIFNIVSSVEFYSCKYYVVLHDKDIINDMGELKKAHYHLLVKLDNAIDIKKIYDILNYSNNERTLQAIVNNLSVVKSFKSMVRYLIHRDNKEKYQYNLEDIITNDKSISYYFNDNTIIDNFQMIYKIIEENNITNFRYLIKWCVENNNIYAMQYIQDNSYLVSCLFR